jgi:hypothetical protein
MGALDDASAVNKPFTGLSPHFKRIPPASRAMYNFRVQIPLTGENTW